MMITQPLRGGMLCVATLLLVGVAVSNRSATASGHTSAEAHAGLQGHAAADALKIHFLEIVTPSADATCEVLSQIHGADFGDPVAELGGARTAALSDGGLISVRAPMHAGEKPAVRPYVMVDDIDAAIAHAREAGAEIAIAGMPIPGRGTIAIYILGGIEHGLWER